LPAMQSFMKADEETLASVLAELAARETEVKKKHRHTGPLAEVTRERGEVHAVRGELKDLMCLLECSIRDSLRDEDAVELCRMYTRRLWPGQRELIRDILARRGKAAAPVIREHLRSERAALPDICAKIQGLVRDTAKGDRIVIPYDRLRCLEAWMRQAIDELEGISQAGS